jgi:hypothetical protein
LAERIISTPATFKSIAFAALIAFLLHSSFMTVAVPPRWILALNSPGIASLSEITTLPSITKQRMSLPFASLMNSWTNILAFKLLMR